VMPWRSVEERRVRRSAVGAEAIISVGFGFGVVDVDFRGDEKR